MFLKKLLEAQSSMLGALSGEAGGEPAEGPCFTLVLGCYYGNKNRMAKRERILKESGCGEEKQKKEGKGGGIEMGRGGPYMKPAKVPTSPSLPITQSS